MVPNFRDLSANFLVLSDKHFDLLFGRFSSILIVEHVVVKVADRSVTLILSQVLLGHAIVASSDNNLVVVTTLLQPDESVLPGYLWAAVPDLVQRQISFVIRSIHLMRQRYRQLLVGLIAVVDWNVFVLFNLRHQVTELLSCNYVSNRFGLEIITPLGADHILGLMVSQLQSF